MKIYRFFNAEKEERNGFAEKNLIKLRFFLTSLLRAVPDRIIKTYRKNFVMLRAFGSLWQNMLQFFNAEKEEGSGFAELQFSVAQRFSHQVQASRLCH